MSDPVVIVIPTPPPTAVVNLTPIAAPAVVPNQLVVPQLPSVIDGGSF